MCNRDTKQPSLQGETPKQSANVEKLFSTTQKSTVISCQTADRNTETSSPQYSIAWLKSDSSKTAVQKEKACSTGLFNGKTGINNHPARRHPIVLLPSEQAQRYRHILL